MPTIETNGIRLFYEEIGHGPPLLCIMGITAPGSVWQLHAEVWAQQFRCVIGDNRGVGKSDKPIGPYSSEMMADDYAGLLDHLKIDAAHVVGCSMGSIIAQQLALNHPDRVASAILMCPWARCDRYAVGVFDHMKRIKARLTPTEFIEYIQLLIFTKPYWDDDMQFRGMEEGRRLAATNENPQPLHALEAQADACIHHNTLNRLDRIACPTLVIGGANDIFTPRWMAEEIAQRIPNAELHLYDGAGHAFHWECMDDFNSRTLQWLRSHS
jgi:pimeloyl-ACP methyl ester carboxylesterase